MVSLRPQTHVIVGDMSDGVHLMRIGNVRDKIAITVRVPEPLLLRIDSYISNRAVPICRNNWLLEAAVAELDRHKTERGERDGS